MTEKPKHRGDVMEREVGEERMLYDAAERNVHVFNDTAYFVWQRCDGRHSVEEIIAEAVKNYGVSEREVRSDVDACIGRLRDLSLLEG